MNSRHVVAWMNLGMLYLAGIVGIAAQKWTVGGLLLCRLRSLGPVRRRARPKADLARRTRSDQGQERYGPDYRRRKGQYRETHVGSGMTRGGENA